MANRENIAHFVKARFMVLLLLTVTSYGKERTRKAVSGKAVRLGGMHP